LFYFILLVLFYFAYFFTFLFVGYLTAGKHEKVVEELMAAGAHLNISNTVAASIFCEYSH
jgi:hypothetical protein